MRETGGATVVERKTASTSNGTPLGRKADRKSTDAIFLSSNDATSSAGTDLARVHSTPYALDTLSLPPLPLSSAEANLLTLAPPKPAAEDTLYPSPSGGFVPSPEEGQDWRLKPPPPGKSKRRSTSHVSPIRPPSLPASQAAEAISSSASRRSSQASSSQQHHRQSAPKSSHRKSSLYRTSTRSTLLPTVTIRDFAFDPQDPRFSGLALPEKEVEEEQPPPTSAHDSYTGPDTFYAEEDDDAEFAGDHGDDQQDLAHGTYRVLYAFEPESEHELAVEVGETVQVIGSIDGGWAIASNSEDQQGLVPATYLEHIANLV